MFLRWTPVVAESLIYNSFCFALHLSSSFTTTKRTVKNWTLSHFPPTRFCWPMSLISCNGKGISGINNPLKCHQIPWSARELRPWAWGIGLLTLDIKQHFMWYDGMTSYNSSFQRCSSQMSYETHYIGIISCRTQYNSGTISMEAQTLLYCVQLQKFLC